MRSETDISAERRALIRAVGVDLGALDARTRAAVEAFGEEVLALREEVAALRAAVREAEALADYDTLCPVFNRRAFERELRREIALAERYGSPFCVVFADLDAFKSINDRFGHAAGDAALVAVAEILEASTRESDIVGRLGGDEFGLLLPHAGLADSENKADELARAVAAIELPVRGRTQKIRLSASFGVSEWGPGETAERLLGRADEAMFARKLESRTLAR